MIQYVGPKYLTISVVRCDVREACSFLLTLVVFVMLYSVHGGDAHMKSNPLDVFTIIPAYYIALNVCRPISTQLYHFSFPPFQGPYIHCLRTPSPKTSPTRMISITVFYGMFAQTHSILHNAASHRSLSQSNDQRNQREEYREGRQEHARALRGNGIAPSSDYKALVQEVMQDNP